ncbi:hypothetical protein PG993_004010 [Apiospora rasikravindrae]|uniref:Uncharacterized protein n=1 Tax=Apiospora rasikravindrae TaxID=990691 RepID=A0ABR1TDB2_9PEZI
MAVSDCERERGEYGGSSIKAAVHHSWGIVTQLFKGRQVVVLLAAVPLAKLNTPMTGLTLHYIPEKFNINSFGLLLFSLGSNIRPALQSVITDLVSLQHVVVLYTVIAVADGVAAAAGALLLNRAFAMVTNWNVGLYLEHRSSSGPFAA